MLVAALVAAPRAGAQVVKRDTTPRTTQKPVARAASLDSLVICSPVEAPARKKPVVRRRVVRRPVARKKPVAAVIPKVSKPRVVAPKPAPRVALKPRRPVVRRVRRTVPRPAAAAPVHSTTIVMCRPVRPLAPLAQGTPTETSVIPVPQVAPPVPVAPVAEEGPPLFVSTAPGVPMAAAGGGRSWLPFAVIPAIFIPFLHSGSNHHGSTPVDTATTPPIVPPDSTPVTPPDTTPTTPPDTTPVTPPDTTPVTPPDTTPILPPPVGPPPTTVPEPGSIVMLGTGLLGLGEVMRRRRGR